MSSDDQVNSSYYDKDEGSGRTKKSRETVIPTVITPEMRGRRRYMRMCKKLRIPPLSRFLKQLGQYVIDMNCAAVGCKDTKAICSALMNQPDIECLNFSANSLQPRALTFLYKLMVTSTKITQLDLADNQLGGRDGTGMSLLVEIVSDNPCLRYLNISGNQIGDADAENVGRLIKEVSGLWELKMSHNQLREKGGMQVGEAIAVNDTLYVLDLSWNHLRGRGAECTALGIMKNTNLVKLDVSWNGFAFEGSVAMAYALKQNTTLTDLNMSSNRIHPPALWELWKGVTENKTLRKISIGHNPISAITTTPLMFMVRNKLENGLEYLDLSGIVVDKEFAAILEEIHKTRPDFRVLYDRSLPVHKDKWAAMMANVKKPVYNVDPVRILFLAKKNLRIIDMFNKMDTDGDCRLTKTEVYQALKREDFSLSSQAVDAIFSYLDVDGDGYLDLSELILGERRLKRRVIQDARVARERDKLEIERGEDGMRGDQGGFGGRFSQTFRPDASQLPDFDPEEQKTSTAPNKLPKISETPKTSPRK